MPSGDAAYHAVLAGSKPLPQLSQAQVELLTREYGETLGECRRCIGVAILLQ